MRVANPKNYEAQFKEFLGSNFSSGPSSLGRNSSLPRMIPPPPSLLTSTTTTVTPAPTMDWHLTGDPETDKLMRGKHSYPNTPRADLATSILMLCKDQSKAAYSGLHMFESFLGYVTGYFDYDENLKFVE